MAVAFIAGVDNLVAETLIYLRRVSFVFSYPPRLPSVVGGDHHRLGGVPSGYPPEGPPSSAVARGWHWMCNVMRFIYQPI